MGPLLTLSWTKITKDCYLRAMEKSLHRNRQQAHWVHLTQKVLQNFAIDVLCHTDTPATQLFISGNVETHLWIAIESEH